MTIHSATDHGYIAPIPRCAACGGTTLDCCDGAGKSPRRERNARSIATGMAPPRTEGTGFYPKGV